MTSTDRRLGELATLHAIGEILNREPEFGRALQLALERLVDLVQADTAWVFLSRPGEEDPHFGGFRLAASVGLPPALTAASCAALTEGSCECEGMFRRGQLDEGMNLVECSRLRNATGDRWGLEVHASVPLEGRTAPVGILNLASAERPTFAPEVLSLLDAVGTQLGVAYERAALLEAQRAEAERAAARHERERVAREVHDAVSQLLFAADLALKVARDADEPERTRAAVDQGAELVEASLSELRGLIELLRSADLEQGLHAALTRLADRTTGTVRVTYHGEPVALDDDAAEVLYRIAQEGIHNAMKHAGPDNVWIRVDRLSGRIRLRVDDDGEGFPEDLHRGVGLESIRARAAALDGRVRTVNRREGGARLEVVIPWRPAS